LLKNDSLSQTRCQNLHHDGVQRVVPAQTLPQRLQ